MPKDVDFDYDENGEFKEYPFQHEEGRYYFNQMTYLTKSALEKELHLNNEQLRKVICLDGGLKCRTVTNQYRSFTVYCLNDVKELFNSK